MKALLIILILTIQTPCLWAEINPFLDPSFQDYVETSRGYMTERKNSPQDLRDALGPIAEFKSPVQYVLHTPGRSFQLPVSIKPAAARRETVKTALPRKRHAGLRLPDEYKDGRLPRKSRFRPFSPVEKKKLLAGLNSFSAEEIKNWQLKGAGKINPAGSEYRVHFAGEAGPLAFAVPPVDFPGSGYLHIKNPASGFKAVPHPQTYQDRAVLRRRRRADVYLSIKIPAGAEPRKFLGMVLKRMNRDAGFVWKKTVELSVSNLADSGPGSAPVFAVVVFGNVPANGVRKLFEYPFVTRLFE